MTEPRSASAGPLRLMVELGPRRKRVVAVAFEWPGWDRSAKTESVALEVHERYRSRYARVADLADLGAAFAAVGAPEIVERVEGIGMTDFYGVSGRPTPAEQASMSDAECERKIALLRAAWATFDAVASRVSADLRRGPRGGGRDRDRIVRHVHGAEMEEYGKKVGVRSDPDAWPDPEAVRAHRDAMCDGIRSFNARGPAAGAWTVQFLIRRCAWHALDHAWEMEDRDLSAGR